MVSSHAVFGKDSGKLRKMRIRSCRGGTELHMVHEGARKLGGVTRKRDKMEASPDG